MRGVAEHRRERRSKVIRKGSEKASLLLKEPFLGSEGHCRRTTGGKTNCYPDHGEATARLSSAAQLPSREENRGGVLGLSSRGGEEVSDRTIPLQMYVGREGKDPPVGEELKHSRERERGEKTDLISKAATVKRFISESRRESPRKRQSIQRLRGEEERESVATAAVKATVGIKHSKFEVVIVKAHHEFWSERRRWMVGMKTGEDRSVAARRYNREESSEKRNYNWNPGSRAVIAAGKVR